MLLYWVHLSIESPQVFLESYRLLRNFHETDEGSTVDEDSVKARINELLSGDKQVCG